MQFRILILVMIICIAACNSDTKERSDLIDIQTSPDQSSELVDQETEPDNTFDKSKWRIKEGKDYPYRDQMLNAIVYNDTIRTLKLHEIMKLLGEPDKINEGHLYYTISQTRILFWPLHTKTMVIKLSEDGSIEWIKIHE